MSRLAGVSQFSRWLEQIKPIARTYNNGELPVLNLSESATSPINAAETRQV
jgi:hypothetical protein